MPNREVGLPAGWTGLFFGTGSVGRSRRHFSVADTGDPLRDTYRGSGWRLDGRATVGRFRKAFNLKPRNGHRSGERWIVRAVAMILENPRYAGRQVWNR